MAKYRFKLMGGTHDQGDGRIYHRGDVVHSDKQLDKQFGSRKFRRLTKDEPEEETPADSDIFAEMTLAELRKFAEEEEISLEGATKKDEVLAKIRVASQ